MEKWVLNWGGILLFVLLSVVGSNCIAYGIKRMDGDLAFSSQGLIQHFLRLFTPMFILGMGLTFAASMMLSVSIRTMDYTRVYPIAVGLGSVGTLTVAYLIFREPITAAKIVGAAFVMVGVFLIGR